MAKEGAIILNEGSLTPDKTLNLTNLLGKRVLSKNGQRVGWVDQVRLNLSGTTVEGIMVTRGAFRKRIFIGKTYIDRLTDNAVILSIDPVIFLKGLKVRTSEGEIIGTVKRVDRKANTNTVDQLIAYQLLRGTFAIPLDAIKLGGQSIILKANYAVPKKHLFKRSG